MKSNTCKSLYDILFLFLITVHPALAQENKAPNLGRHTIQNVLSIFVNAFANLDWKTFRACFIENPTMFHPAAPNIKRVDSREQFEKEWLGVFEESAEVPVVPHRHS